MADKEDRIDVQALRRQLRDQTAQHHHLGGRLASLMERLKDEFGLESLEDAKAKLKESGAELDELDRQLDEVLVKLDKYGEA